MATLVSVNVGLPKNVAWNGRTVYTGVWKQPVTGPRMVRRLNVDGDGQGDLGGHGGENRAVLVYQLDSYRYWSDQLRRDDLQPGHFGENFTVEGLPDDEVCIGDRYRIGQAVFEVTQPRVTCYRVGLRLREPQMAALLVSHRRPGFYFRVITEGEVRAGDEKAAPPTGVEPGWSGFRPLVVHDVVKESSTITSFRFVAPALLALWWTVWPAWSGPLSWPFTRPAKPGCPWFGSTGDSIGSIPSGSPCSASCARRCPTRSCASTTNPRSTW